MIDVPRSISSMTRLVDSGRRTTLVSARRNGYGKCAARRGSMPCSAGTPCLEDLLPHLREAEDDRVHESVRAQEEREVRAAVAEALGRVAHRGHREVAALGAARGQVADARAVVVAAASRPGPLLASRCSSASASAAWLLDEQDLVGLGPPSERGDVVVSAVHDPGLAGARLAGQQRDPLGELGLVLAQPLATSPARGRR